MHEKAKIAILISGSGSNMTALLYASRLPSANFEVVLVASNDPQAGGLERAKTEGVATFALSHRGMERADHDAAMEKAITDAGAEYIALAGYMRILTGEFVGRWRERMLNIHPSLLPKYRGLDTHQRALDAGDKCGGVSVHLVSEELDAGQILGQIPVAIAKGDNAQSLAKRVLAAEHQLYPQMLSDYVGRLFNPDWLLNRIDQMAKTLPEAHRAESHGSPAWRAGGDKGKIFAHFLNQHHGDAHIALLAKTSGKDELNELVASDPDCFFKPAYYGASGWVGIVLDRKNCDWGQVQYWLERSWRAVAPKRLTKLIEAAQEF